MINFRYHVVSLTAVFLSLAIGVVVGTSAANGPVADYLNDEVTTMHKQNGQLRDEIETLTEENRGQDQAWAAAAANTLPGRLAGRRVLLVAMPSAEKHLDGVTQLIGMAGGKVTNRVVLSDSFVDPSNNDTLLDIADNAAPPAVRATLPSHSNGVETSSALLAAMFLGGGAADSTRTVITAFQSQKYLSLTGEPTGAEAVVFLVGATYTGDNAAKRNAATVTVAQRFGQAGRLVVAATGTSGDGNVVRAVRDDPEMVKTTSSVDNVSTTMGRFTVVLALAEKLEGRVGHYGLGSGATGYMPVPAGVRDGA